MSSSMPASRRWAREKLLKNQLSRQVNTLREELAGRDQVIGELTVANRILKKLSPRSDV